MTWTSIILNSFSRTREWRGMYETIRGILKKWDEIAAQSSLLEFSMPDRVFTEQFCEILKAFNTCYNRLEDSSAEVEVEQGGPLQKNASKN